MEEKLPQVPTTPVVVKQSFFKRFWWSTPLLILISLALIFVAYNTISVYLRNKQVEDKRANFDERIVKSFEPSSGTAFKYASPMLYNEHIYIGTSERIGYDNAPIAKMHDNFFYKFDLDLNVVWQYPLQKKMTIGGVVMDSNHNLYFVTEQLNDKNGANKKEYIFSTVFLTSLTEGGQFRWEKQISVTDEYWDHVYLTPAISTDDVIYIGQDHFYAFDVNGNLLAKYPVEENIRLANYGGAPVIDAAGNVYFTAPQPINITTFKSEKEQPPATDVFMAYKFTPKLAKLVWSTVMGNEVLDRPGGYTEGGGQKASGIEPAPAFGVGGKTLYGVVGCTISKFDTTTGQLLWSLKPDGATGHFSASPAVDGEDILYIGTKSNNESRFYAISPEGKQIWRTEIGADLYNPPVLANNGMIYVGSEGTPLGRFHTIDRKTGVKVATMFSDDYRKVPDFSHDAMVLYKGYAYVGVHSAETENSSTKFVPTFYKIKVDATDYLPGAAWPRIYGGNSNSGRQQ